MCTPLEYCDYPHVLIPLFVQPKIPAELTPHLVDWFLHFEENGKSELLSFHIHPLLAVVAWLMAEDEEDLM